MTTAGRADHADGADRADFAAFAADIGIIDLGMGFPYRSVEEKKAAYDFFRPLLRDRQSAEEFEFPAEYMFKDVPDVVGPDVDPVAWTVAAMDAHGIDQAVVGLGEHGTRAKAEHPGRFHLMARVDPHQGVDGLRALSAAHAEHGIVAAMCFPSGTFPQVGIDDKKMYPIYTRCVELGIPICINGGVVGPRMPSWPQQVERFDNVLYDFPELTMVMMHGGEPWTALAVKLMLKWPGLHYMTSAFAPRHYPEDIVAFANTRGADKVMFCGYFPAGLTLERQMRELPDVPFRDHVWPKFLRENAQRVFRLPERPERPERPVRAARVED